MIRLLLINLGNSTLNFIFRHIKGVVVMLLVTWIILVILFFLSGRNKKETLQMVRKGSETCS